VRWLAENPAKRRLELFVLAYTVAWAAVIGAAQALRFFAAWRDPGFMALGVGLALPLALAPAALGRVAWRYFVCVALLAFLQCYFGSWLFFDLFGMKYRFPVTWIWNRTPLFLYFMTVAYFGTYFVVLGIAWRALHTRFPSLPAPLRIAARALLCYAMAFTETASMATRAMREWFSYGDARIVMIYGSIGYGLVFFCTLPLFADLDERSDDARPLWTVVRDLLALNMIAIVIYELFAVIWRYTIGRLPPG
jgi:hypothetical protein